MAPAPTLKATTAQAETFAGVTYHVDGELVPVLTVELSAVPVYFEHHILLWKDTQTQIGVKSLSGVFKRVLSGMPVDIRNLSDTRFDNAVASLIESHLYHGSAGGIAALPLVELPAAQRRSWRW